MYAVIITGGKQYKVAPGDTLKVEKIEAEVGSEIAFEQVLLVQDENNGLQIGTPKLDNAKVLAEVKSHGRGDKIRIIKFRRRKHHMKRMGHRQYYTEVEIKNISH